MPLDGLLQFWVENREWRKDSFNVLASAFDACEWELRNENVFTFISIFFEGSQSCLVRDLCYLLSLSHFDLFS